MADRRVLLIDTDKQFHEVLRRSLHPYGVDVQVVSDGSDGVARAIEVKPELIFIAVDLPDKAGYGICNKIRRGATRGIPVALITSTVAPSDFEQHRKLPKGHADAYFDKRTLDQDELVRRIDELITLGPPVAEEEFPVEDIPFEDDAVAVEEEMAVDQVDEDTGYDRTRISAVVDPSIDQETESAFAGLVDTPIEEDFEHDDQPATHVRSAIDPSVFSAGNAEAAPPAAPDQTGEIDLGLDAVAEAANEESGRVEQDDRGDDGRVAELQAEIARLRKDLEDARKAAPAAGGGQAGSVFSREREFLNLRELINRKEKEILDLKEEVDARDRQILNGKDKIRELERKLRDSDTKNLEVEGQLVTANETIEAVTGERDQALEREKGLRTRLDVSQGELRKANEKIAELEKKAAAEARAHADELSRRDAAAAEARRQAEDALAKARAEAEHALAAADERRKNELAQQKKELEDERAGVVAAMEADREAEIASLEKASEEAAAAMREEHAGEIAALHAAQEEAIAKKDREQRDALARAAQEREAALQKAEERRVADLRDAAERRQADLAAAEERRESELAAAAEEMRQALAAAEQRREKELADAESRRQREIRDLEAQHAAALAAAADDKRQTLAAAEARREKELGEAEARRSVEIANLNQEHEETMRGLVAAHDEQVAELKAEIDALTKALGSARDAIRSLEQDLGSAKHTIGERDAHIGRLVADVAQRDERIAAQKAEIEDLERQNAGFQEQILKAYQKIKSDEATVAKAKKAMAVALTLLDEQHGGPGQQSPA